jgi:hypothetical protein
VESKLIDLNLPTIAARLPDAILDPNDPNRAEALAQLGLLQIDQKDQAGALATQAIQASAAIKKSPKGPPEPPPPSLIALMVALDHSDAKKLSPPKDNSPLELRVGFTWGWAYRGQLGEARALATSAGPASHQLEALIALVAVLLEKKADIEMDLASAVDRIEPALKEKDTKATPWTLYRLAGLAVRAGKLDFASKVADLISDSDLRYLAKLEIALATFDKKSDMDVLSHFAGQKPACRHALLELARRSTRSNGSSTVSNALNDWEPELRPLGYAGIALGMQDGEK